MRAVMHEELPIFYDVAGRPPPIATTLHASPLDPLIIPDLLCRTPSLRVGRRGGDLY